MSYMSSVQISHGNDGTTQGVDPNKYIWNNKLNSFVCLKKTELRPSLILSVQKPVTLGYKESSKFSFSTTYNKMVAKNVRNSPS